MKHDTVIISVSSVVNENIWEANKTMLRKRSKESVEAWHFGNAGLPASENKAASYPTSVFATLFLG